MALLSTLKTTAPYHILSFGFLFGASLFQSFINGIVAWKALSKAQFSQLQQKLFPIYFALQVFLSFTTLITLPTALRTSRLAQAMLGLSLFAGAANLVYIGPKTTDIMLVRKRQETVDGRSYEGKKMAGGTGEKGKMRGGELEKEDTLVGQEMGQLNKAFAIWHGVSSFVNLAGIIGTVVYGVQIGSLLETPVIEYTTRHF